MEFKKINYQYLDMLEKLEENSKIVDAKYCRSKKTDMVVFEFKVKTDKTVHKYVFQADNYYTLNDCLDLYRQFKINKRNKNLRIKKFATRATAFTAACVLSATTPIAINSIEEHRFQNDVNIETKKVLSEITSENPGMKINGEIIDSIRQDIERQMREEDIKEANREKILSTGEYLDEYYAKLFKDDPDNPVYQAYLEYVNEKNEQIEENAKKTR